ncbi:MAG: T9SS type A sorting domain-containing protein, partial [Bacteroidota bacterium]
FQALTQNLKPSVVTVLRNTVDGNDNTFVIGDTLKIKDSYTNYLAATTNLTATLSTTSVHVTILDGTTTLGAVATLATTNNNADPYKVRILSSAPLNQPIQFKLTFSDAANSYTAVEYFTIIVNVDYINITINDVATTINSRGRIGYNLDNQVGGLGFNYMNQGSILYEGGLMIGTDTGKVSDGVRGYTSAPENEFQSMVNVRRINPPAVSEFDVDGTFNDNLAKIPLKIKVHHNAYAWTTAGDRKYVIVQYVISNTGTSSLNNLYAGIFADWDIDVVTFKENRSGFDAATKMGYVYHTATNGKYGGIKLLTHLKPVLHYAMDNVAGGAGGIDPYTGGYNGFDKYSTLSSNRPNAGVTGAGEDILDVVSTGPYTIAVGDSIKVAFALLAGDDLPDLKNSAANAQIKYDGLMTGIANNTNTMNNPNVFAVYPNPTNAESNINIYLAEASSVQLVVYDLLGKEIKTIVSEKMPEGSHRFVFDASALSNGLYYYQLNVNDQKYVQKLIVNK